MQLVEVWSGFIWPRIGQVMDSLWHLNGPPGSIKCGEYLGHLRYCQLLCKEPARSMLFVK
jgi:hypothetical protein